MTAPRLALSPRPDLPPRGDVLGLTTPIGVRYARVSRATPERVTLRWLTPEETGQLLLTLYDRLPWWRRAKGRALRACGIGRRG